MKIRFLVILFFITRLSSAQTPLTQGAWFGNLIREDGRIIRFHLDVRTENKKPVFYIINASERVRIDKIRYTNDSVFFEMPVFESSFKARRVSPQRWEGVWMKGAANEPQVMKFIAEMQALVQSPALKPAVADISGRWAVTFTEGNEISKPAVGEWQQKGNTLRGTFLTPTGDYRYLSGVVDGDSMRLSAFDGVHAFVFTAKIENKNTIGGGTFFSGPTHKEPWEAVRNAGATLPDVAGMYFKDGNERVKFRFRDLNGKWVSLSDAKFKNKVVVLQILGSWCPNCMDETAFLSEYYNRNKEKGIEFIGLAYEYSTDLQRSKKSIEKFKNRFNVQYTLLNTGVTVGDSLRTEKTLPQFTNIKSFPTTIYIDRNGKFVKTKAGFEGPGTGAHYEAMKKEFEETISALLRK